jgi:acetylornithine deacetylase/succinyl-diaminopimelate desuccinylase-like protein
VFLALALSAAAFGQRDGAEAARAWREANEGRILAEFFELLRLPNVAADKAGIARNAAWLRAQFEKRGVKAALLEAEGASPVVLGEIEAPGAGTTVIFYAHYDGQPAEARQWTGHAPWEPILRSGLLENDARRIEFPAPGGKYDPEWRIYARSASDDKAPIQAMLAALDGLKARGLQPSVNIKFVLEGEEEAGSRNLGRILAANRERLRADFWIICDGPVHQSRKMQVVFGARGALGFNLTVYGPKRELHSGHYGNWAPNPALMLAHLVASMRDGNGRVRIGGFYDTAEPLGESDRLAAAAAPAVEEELKNELGLARPYGEGRRLAELVNEPVLNVRGLSSAAVGEESRNVVPAEATASFDIRMVRGDTPERMMKLVRAHLEGQGYYVVEQPPSQAERMKHPRIARVWGGDFGYRGVRTPMESRAGRMVVDAVEQAAGGPVIRIPTSGGSVPLAIIEDTTGAPTVSVPIVNHDNSQHAPNENLRLANLWDGIEVMGALFRMREPGTASPRQGRLR